MIVHGFICWILMVSGFSLAKSESNNASINIPGDVIIVGIFEGYLADGNGCADVDVPSAMVMEAMKWTIDKINKAEFVPLKIGLQSYVTCGKVYFAGDAANTIVYNAKTGDSSANKIIGVIGPKYSSETELVSRILSNQLPENQLLQLGFSATAASLDNKMTYPNFYRVIPDDTIQVQTMIRMMVDLQWTRIAIIYENDTYGQGAANNLQIEATKNHICIAMSSAITIDASRDVSSDQIKEILNSLAIAGTKIGAAVYIGNRDVAKKVLLVTDTQAYRDVPIFLLSETAQLQMDIFKKSEESVFTKSLGSLITSVPYDKIGGFQTYWLSLFTNKEAVMNESVSNPLLKDVFESYSGCALDDPSCQPPSLSKLNALHLFQPTYIRYGVIATHVMAKILKQVYNTICDATHCVDDFLNTFRSNMMIEEIDGLTVSFPDDFVSGIESSGKPMTLTFSSMSANPKYNATDAVYEAYTFVKDNPYSFAKIGNMTNERLTLDKAQIVDYDENGKSSNYPNVRKGQCDAARLCSECIVNDVSELVYHIPGDVYVIGIVSINNKHLETTQGCGAVRDRHGFQMVLAMEFGLDTFLNSSEYRIHKEMFSGIRIGLVVLNSCNNPLEIDRRLLNLHKDGITLDDGSHLDLTNRILGYIGGQSTDISEPAAAQLSKLGFVQISYSSTNPSLSDKSKYPYFMRIVTPDDVQATAMMELVQGLDGEYIQVVHSEGKYGEGGRDYVIKAAEQKDICITQVIEVPESSEYFKYYELMRRKPHAKVVIVFLRSHVVSPFMKDMEELMRPGEFQFIGSEAWATNKDMLNYAINKGSLTMTLQIQKNNDLDEYIKGKIPVWGITHPWLSEYLQNRQDCYFPWSFNKEFSSMCSNSTLPVTDSSFESDFWCIFATDTLLSFLKGSAMFYNQSCKTGSGRQLCPDYIDNPSGLVQEMKKVQIDIHGSGPIPIYNDLGDGSMGYKLFNIRQRDGSSQRDYVEVGSYSVLTGLTFDKNMVRFPTDDVITSTCPNAKACEACKKQVQAQTTPDEEKSVAAFVLGGLLGLACVVIVVMLMCIIFKCRLSTKEEDPYDPYLTPTDGFQRERESGDGVQYPEEHYDMSNSPCTG